MTYPGIIALALLLALVALQWHLARQARKAEGQAVPYLPPEVEAKLREHGKVLLYFFSPHCGPCRSMTPRIDRVNARHATVFKFDVARSLDLARQLGVMATPTTLRIVGDRIERVRLGALSAAAIEQLVA